MLMRMMKAGRDGRIDKGRRKTCEAALIGAEIMVAAAAAIDPKLSLDAFEMGGHASVRQSVSQAGAEQKPQNSGRDRRERERE